MPVARRLRITGRVQGVFYRAWFAERARGLALAGWVRNRADSSVEAVISGDPIAVNDMIALARQGSPASRVVDVLVSEAEAGDLGAGGFETRPTV